MKDFKMTVSLKTFVFFLTINGLQSFDLPENTCDYYLTFQRDGYAYKGILRIPNDYTGRYTLVVNGSLPFQTNKRMRIEVDNYNEIITRPVPELIYTLHFDSNKAFPKITEVVFNGNLLCSAARYPLIPGGPGITNMWSSSIVESSVQKQGNSFDQNYGNFNHHQPPLTKPIGFTTKPEITNSIDIRQGEGNRNDKCGISTKSFSSNKVLGSKVADGEFPWLVAIFFYEESNNFYKYHCTGTLISTSHAITAGHCLQFENILLHEKEDIILVLGQSSLSNWARAKVRGEVSRIDVHPSYSQGKSGHDLAILTMEKPVTISPTVSPICLWNKDGSFGSLEGMEGVVAGWGQPHVNSRDSMRANRATMSVGVQQECLKRNSALNSVMSKATFCAGGENSSGSCGGDSGAGFYMQINDRFYLRGLVAFTMNDGINRCDPTSYVVFADFLPDLNWISNVITK